MSKDYKVSSISDLTHVIEEILNQYSDIKVWLFRGDLGAGKTTFIKELGAFLGVVDSMSSPTFSIVNEYITDTDQSINHFDFYRIKDPEELMEIGIEEYLNSGNYCFIEWPDMAGELLHEILPQKNLEININLEDQNSRHITVASNG